MSELKLKLDYPITEETYKETKTNAVFLSCTYIEMAVNNVYRQGLNGQQRRIWGRTQRKLGEATEKQSDSVELEPEEVKFIKKVFETTTLTFPPNLAKLVIVLEDEIANL